MYAAPELIAAICVATASTIVDDLGDISTTARRQTFLQRWRVNLAKLRRW